MTQASGAQVSLRFVREAVRGVTPAGVTTPVTNVEAEATGAGGAGFSMFKRASGSWITDGFVPGQWVRAAGFAAGANNTAWKVAAVSALDLEVYDPTDALVDEAPEAGQNVRIVFTEFRATGRNVNLEKATLESAEVRTDGLESDVRHGFNRVVGNPGYELSSESFDDPLEALFGRPWESVTTVSGVNIGINQGTKIIDRASGSFVTDGYRPGDIVRTTGFANSVNNADWQVLTVAALSLTVADPDNAIITEAAAGGRTVAYPGKRLDLGTLLPTFTVERVFADVSQYEVFRGVAIAQASFEVQPEALVGGTMDLLGMIAEAVASSPKTSADPYPRPTTAPFAAFDGRMYEGGSLIAVATGLTFTVNRNRSLAAVIGSKYSPDVFQGIAQLAGTLTAFFENATMLNKFRNENNSSMYLKMQDPTTATVFMTFVFPKVKYVGGQMDPPPTGPVPISMPFRALVATGLAVAGGTTRNTSMSIQRSNAV